jgi:endonuclease/exonuclease/phosphatase family metal-dependent hydrolase
MWEFVLYTSLVKKNFSILTFNTGLFFVPFLGRSIGLKWFCPVGNFYERRKKMPEELLKTNADVICLQEVYHQDDKMWFLGKLKEVYPYSEVNHRKMNWQAPNSLMIFSKFPITKHSLHLFIKHPYGEKVTRKGFTVSEIDLDGKGISVVNTHSTIGGLPHSGNLKIAVLTQHRHTNRMLNVIENKHNDLIVGDLNTGPVYSPTGYKILLKAGYVDVFGNNKKEPITYSAKNSNSKDRAFMDSWEHRIDHVLMSSKTTLVLEKSEIVLKEKHLSDHFGVIAEFKVK